MQILEGVYDIESVKNTDLIIHTVTKDEVINEDYTVINNIFKILFDAEKYSREKLMIVFDGYTNDKREIYMIPEIRRYVQHIFYEYESLFYFLTNIHNNNQMLLACLSGYNVTRRKDKVKLEIIKNNSVIERMAIGMLKQGCVNDDLELVEKQIEVYK